MGLHCTRCDGSGFLNIDQLPEKALEAYDDGDEQKILSWIATNEEHDVQVCDCCGDGEEGWYGEIGIHYNADDPRGPNGPYAYNGGLCECN